MNMVDQFLAYEYGKTKQKFRIEDCLDGKVGFSSWKPKFQDELYRLLAIDAEPKYEIDMEEPQGEVEGYALSKMTYILPGGLICPCYILKPKKPKAVVLAFHGHGIGVKDILGTVTEDSYQHHFALELCKKGFVVLAPEFLGFGTLRLQKDYELGDDPDAWSCHRLSMNLLASGKSLLGMRVTQAKAVLRIARNMYPEKKLGVMGISGGGTVATFLSALEDSTIASVVISGYANYFKDSILDMHHCVCNYLAGMLQSFELPTLVSSIAPIPMLWESGSMDPIYPQESARKAENITRKVYEKWGNGSDFKTDYFEGIHEIHGIKAYEFLEKHLK